MTEDKSILDKAQEVAKDVAEKAKEVATELKEKVSSFVEGHEEQIHSGIDKTGEFVDDKTKGRYSEKIDKAQDAAKGAVSKLGHPETDAPDSTLAAPPEVPATSTSTAAETAAETAADEAEEE